MEGNAPDLPLANVCPGQPISTNIIISGVSTIQSTKTCGFGLAQVYQINKHIDDVYPVANSRFFFAECIVGVICLRNIEIVLWMAPETIPNKLKKI